MKLDTLSLSTILMLLIITCAIVIHPVLAENVTPNTTPHGNINIQIIKQIQNQAGITYIARGDDYTFSGAWDPSKNLKKEAFFWLFGTYGSLEPIYDQPVEINSENNYHIYFKSLQTSGLKPGNFVGVVQFTGPNGIREVKYDREYDELSSPFRDVQPVSIHGDTPNQVYAKLITMIKNNAYSDDTYLLYDMRVEEPWISVGDSQSDGDLKDPEVTIYGETNIGTSNSLIAIIDVEKQVTAAKLKEATKVLKIFPYTDPMHPRNTWNLSFKTSTLYPGEHTITVKSIRFNVDTSTDFDLREISTNPTPTPTPIRIIGFPTTEPTPTPIPTPTAIPTTPVVIIQTPIPTTIPPTPVPTTIIIETPTPKKLFMNAKESSPLGKSLLSMPISPIIPLAGLVVAFLVLRRREDD